MAASRSPAAAPLLGALLALLLLCSCGAAPLSGWVSGTASFFGGPPDQPLNAFNLTIPTGSCGYGSIDPRLYPFYYVVGLSPNNTLVQNRPQHGCGTCLEVSCIDSRGICHPTAPVVAMLTDECVEDCDTTHVNFHVFGFETLAPIRFGRVDIKYRQVECEPVDHIIVRVSDYRVAEGGWLRMSFKNVAGDAGIAKVEVTPSKPEDDGASGVVVGQRYDVWRPMLNTFGANWEISQLSSPPLDFRVTNVYGQQVVLRKIITVAGGVGEFESAEQFPLRSASAPATSAPNTTAATIAAPGAAAPSGNTSAQSWNSSIMPAPASEGVAAAIDVVVPPAANATAAAPRPANSSAAAAALAQEVVQVVRLATDEPQAATEPSKTTLARKVAAGGLAP